MRYRVYIDDKDKDRPTQFFGTVLSSIDDELAERLKGCRPGTKWQLYETTESLIRSGEVEEPPKEDKEKKK